MPESTHTFDVFVIGGGPAGQTLAEACAREGLRVGITEYRGYGGTCALRGCDPKRVLVTRTMALHDAHRLDGHGLEGVPAFSWSHSRAAVDAIIGPIPDKARDALREAGITVLSGQAKFVGPRALAVDGHRVTAEHIVIATGQRPAPLDVPGAAFAKTSDDFHQLPELPRRIVLIGGGYIGLETAHLCARAGREVAVLNNDDDPLPTFDPELVERFIDCTRDLGIDYRPNTAAKAIERLRDGEGFRVSVETADGDTDHLVCDLVVNAGGRIPNLDTLDLARAGIPTEGKGIPVDVYFRVPECPGVYAIGDIALSGAPPLTPVANLEARALARTLLGENTACDYRGVATVVYATPELACVGLTEREAEERGIAVEVRALVDARHKFNARRSRATAYGFKVLVDPDDRIVGAHLLGPLAGEQINVLALAIRSGLTAETLREMPFAYPTWGSDVSAMASPANARKPICSRGSEG